MDKNTLTREKVNSILINKRLDKEFNKISKGTRESFLKKITSDEYPSEIADTMLDERFKYFMFEKYLLNKINKALVVFMMFVLIGYTFKIYTLVNFFMMEAICFLATMIVKTIGSRNEKQFDLYTYKVFQLKNKINC